MQVWPHPHGWVYASAEVCQARGGANSPRSRCARRVHGSYSVLPRQAYQADLRLLPDDGWIRPDLNYINTMFVGFVWGTWPGLEATRIHWLWRAGGTKVSPGRGNVTSILRCGHCCATAQRREMGSLFPLPCTPCSCEKEVTQRLCNSCVWSWVCMVFLVCLFWIMIMIYDIWWIIMIYSVLWSWHLEAAWYRHNGKPCHFIPAEDICWLYVGS